MLIKQAAVKICGAGYD